MLTYSVGPFDLAVFLVYSNRHHGNFKTIASLLFRDDICGID